MCPHGTTHNPGGEGMTLIGEAASRHARTGFAKGTEHVCTVCAECRLAGHNPSSSVTLRMLVAANPHIHARKRSSHLRVPVCACCLEPRSICAVTQHPPVDDDKLARLQQGFTETNCTRTLHMVTRSGFERNSPLSPHDRACCSRTYMRTFVTRVSRTQCFSPCTPTHAKAHAPH